MKRLIVTAIAALALGVGSTYAATNVRVEVHSKNESTVKNDAGQEVKRDAQGLLICQEAVPSDSWWDENGPPTCPDWSPRGAASSERHAMTDVESLRAAEVAYRAAFGRSEELRAQRNRAIRAAIAAGWTHSEIADATGLTRARVGQIAQSS